MCISIFFRFCVYVCIYMNKFKFPIQSKSQYSFPLKICVLIKKMNIKINTSHPTVRLVWKMIQRMNAVTTKKVLKHMCCFFVPLFYSSNNNVATLVLCNAWGCFCTLRAYHMKNSYRLSLLSNIYQIKRMLCDSPLPKSCDLAKKFMR